LRGDPPNFSGIKERLLNCAGADRLRRLGQEEDLAFCTTLDSHQLVPVVNYQKYPAARAWAAKCPRK
jgi:2-phosphosulfolactate phosphatase